jgi:hypothetical protein
MNSPQDTPLDVIPGNTGFSLCGISQNGTHRLKPVLLNPQKFNGVTPNVFYHLRKTFGMPQKSPNVFNHLQAHFPVTTCVFYHLRKISRMLQKYPNVFYHLQTISAVTTCVSYHLRKKGGEGGSAVCICAFCIPMPWIGTDGLYREGCPLQFD